MTEERDVLGEEDVKSRKGRHNSSKGTDDLVNTVYVQTTLKKVNVFGRETIPKRRFMTGNKD